MQLILFWLLIKYLQSVPWFCTCGPKHANYVDSYLVIGREDKTTGQRTVFLAVIVTNLEVE